MEYFDEMCTKWGFSDGNAVPPDAAVRREIYVRSLNTLAEKFGSEVRAVAFDRGGVHNWCLLLFMSVDTFARIPTPDWYEGTTEWDWEEVEPDEAMNRAIDELANPLDIENPDAFAIVEARIDCGFEQFLLELKEA